MSIQMDTINWIQGQMNVAYDGLKKSEPDTENWIGWNARIAALQMATSVLDDNAKAIMYYNRSIVQADEELSAVEVESPEWIISKAHLTVFEELLDVVRLGLPKLRR